MHSILIVVGDLDLNPGKDGKLIVTHIDGCIVSNKQDMVVYFMMANYHGSMVAINGIQPKPNIDE